MHDILKSLILSLVEGVTEFLPISSTGHLILVNKWVQFSGSFSNSFNVIIQFGAILSVIVLYWHKLYPFSPKKSRLERDASLDIWKKVIVGFIPAMVLGFLFGDFIEEKLFNPTTVAVMLIIGGIAILLLEKRSGSFKINSFGELTYKNAFLIGLIQCLAMIPGTSRSASTIIGAMLRGTSREIAAEFSFFLAIPTMAGATAFSLLKNGLSISGGEWITLLSGVFFSFLIAMAVISFFMNYIKKHDFKLFAYYRIVLGIVVLLFFSKF